jgi:hypothetical protein
VTSATSIDAGKRERWRRYGDKHSAFYYRQMRFYDRVLFGDSQSWVCSARKPALP